jgi:hypothetical protein
VAFHKAYEEARRIFTAEQARELRNRIVKNYVSNELYCCDPDFKRGAVQFFEEIRTRLEDPQPST